MNKSEREKIKQETKLQQELYLQKIIVDSEKALIARKFINFNNKFKRFLRCEFASNNSLKQIPLLSSLIFGIQEYQRQLGISQYEFAKELNAINKYLIFALDTLSSSKYNSKCPSYGEALLNCYLDLYITFTINRIDKEINAYPGFLINPLTGANLELDVLFENFKLAFEFQGEHHYTDSTTQTKDSFKLNSSNLNNHILIPVNISQLSHICLTSLICNSIKEQKSLTPLVNNLEKVELPQTTLYQFFKVIQRCYLAHKLFKETLDWLDIKSQNYINGRLPSSPVSASTCAPRLNHISDNDDLSIDELYRLIPQMRKLESN